jgi:hypothetical protein
MRWVFAQASSVCANRDCHVGDQRRESLRNSEDYKSYKNDERTIVIATCGGGSVCGFSKQGLQLGFKSLYSHGGPLKVTQSVTLTHNESQVIESHCIFGKVCKQVLRNFEKRTL